MEGTTVRQSTCGQTHTIHRPQSQVSNNQPVNTLRAKSVRRERCLQQCPPASTSLPHLIIGTGPWPRLWTFHHTTRQQRLGKRFKVTLDSSIYNNHPLTHAPWPLPTFQNTDIPDISVSLCKPSPISKKGYVIGYSWFALTVIPEISNSQC